MSNKLVSVIVILILIIGSFLLFKNRGVAPTEVEIDAGMPVVGSEVEETQVIEEGATIREFVFGAAPFSFSPPTMVVNQGDIVRVTVKNAAGTHSLRIDQFNASTRILNAGEEETITFVADKIGTFEFYCSVGDHRARGMLGTLTVH